MARRAQNGILSRWERVRALADVDSFVEVGASVRQSSKEAAYGDGVVAGTGGSLVGR
ncbi:hypothetical protein [Nocardia sp. NPDC051463]|uniref:hypothetical protein n=1 Tax=Nocardia sp. NPDC051463 TaxID=3154845 RepID=UPI003420AA48